MKFRRDPRDRRYAERLAGSFLASLLLHALLAALLFTVLVSSSQEGANENVQGAEVVTLSQNSPVSVANQPVVTQAAPPVPHVPKIAPLHHAPIVAPQSQRLPTNRHELAKTAPSAPPNPRPIPQTTPQPNPQPTQNVFETQPATEVPAAPMSVPTLGPVAIATKPPPTIAPSAAPSAAPAVRATPKPPVPTARPSARPASPAPALPKPSPSAAAPARASPAPVTGVPSPSPTSTSAVARSAGAAPKPAPSGAASPGPRPGSGAQAHAAAPAPIAVRPMPTSSPNARATAAPKRRSAPDINARLRGMLPNNPVNPTSKQYTPSYSLRGRLEPTPPPEVLARTQYMYESKGVGNDARVKMWVVSARKAGPTTMCTGWLVRYPEALHGGYAEAAGPDSSIVHSDLHGGPANGTQIAIGGGGSASKDALSPFAAGIAPIVVGMITEACDGRLLVHYTPSPAPSVAPSP